MFAPSRSVVAICTMLALGACSGRAGPPSDARVDAPGADGPVPDQRVDRGPLPKLAIRIDGLFEDWGSALPLATDPAGDGTQAFDVTRLYAATRGTELFLRFDIGAELNLSAGAPGEGDLRIVLGLAEQRSLTIQLRGRKAIVAANGSSTVADWLDLGYRIAPTYAATEFELGLDLKTIGAKLGDIVTIEIAGSDQVAAVALELLHEALPLERRSAARPAGTIVRVVSQNTRFDGLTDPLRGPRLARLIRAAAPDVYCAQEQFQSTAAELAATLQAIDPQGDGKPWNVHQGAFGDTAIASRWPLTALPSFANSHSVAAVELPAGSIPSHLVVVSMRPKCCGYIGSFEDQKRIADLTGLAKLIAALRARTLGAAFVGLAEAPVIVAGDWNLVGSRTPLTILEEATGPALTQLVAPQLVGNEVWTWRARGQSFPPGRLDILVYSADKLRALGGFLLRSDNLDADELTTLGLQAQDSLGSDHLAVVGDFGAIIP